MTRRDWWLGSAALVVAILLHALLPRYEYQHLTTGSETVVELRVDRWTGRARLAVFTAKGEVLGP